MFVAAISKHDFKQLWFRDFFEEQAICNYLFLYSMSSLHVVPYCLIAQENYYHIIIGLIIIIIK